MILTDDELQLVYGVFDECLKLGYPKLNRFLGSITIERMQELHSKIYLRDYCERRGVRFEDMTAEDFERAYSCENEWGS